jgi:RimJ/RimL family protein N-acetyltransferase
MLKGEKVILRPVERDDLKRLHELRANVDLWMQASGDWEPVPLASMERWYEKGLDEDDKAWFAIEADGKVIGDTGLHHRNRRNGVTAFGIAILDPEYLGKGYGRDAINLLLDWAFRIVNYRRVWLETGANNERARRAYLACGFVEEGRLREHEFSNGVYEDMIVMGILRTEWEARRSAKQA